MLEKSRLVKLLLLDEDVSPRRDDLQFENVVGLTRQLASETIAGKFFEISFN